MAATHQLFRQHTLRAATLLLMAAVGAAGESPQVAAPGLAAALQPFVDNQTLAGAVILAASRDKILALEAVGCADLAAKKPMQTDCLFWIASQSKPIAAAALMMLVDQGRVRLADPVEKHLPEFKGQQVLAGRDAAHPVLRSPQHPITVRNLLTHTTGLPYKAPIEEPTLDRLPLAVRVQHYAKLPLAFEPGSKYQYSNAGVNTAARIVEVVSGIPYAEYLDQRLFQPLGMKDTTFWPDAAQIARLAKSYRPTADKQGIEETTIDRLRYPLDDRSRQPVPGNGLFSTATDLLAFYRMIVGGGVEAGRRYLSEQAVKEMTSKQTGDLPVAYGLGFSTERGCIGHAGSYNTHSEFDKDRQLITIFLTQQAAWRNPEGKRVPELARQTAERLFSGVKPRARGR